MTLKKSCAIAGVAESRLGVVPDSTVLTLQAEAMVKALAEAGLEKKRRRRSLQQRQLGAPTAITDIRISWDTTKLF